jgi:predicted DNA-binding transcriptional regulator AlpA
VSDHDNIRQLPPVRVPASGTNDGLWDIVQVSAYLRVPVQTLYYWRKKRQGPPASRVGRHLRYDPAQVRAWVNNRAA